MSDALMHNYARFPVTFTKGDGVYLWDKQNTKYLDALGGIAVCGLGHSHPEIAAAIAEQANTLLHTSNLYGIDLQTQLAEKLAEISGMHNAYFANSGAEANEAAIKIARLWAHTSGNTLPVIVTMHGGFHGRTMGVLAATAKPSIQQGFEPLLENFEYVEYDNIAALEHTLSATDNVCAVMLEPIQGERGVVVPSTGYLKAVRDLCDQHNVLMICDEVQSGIGRTGKWFAYQHENILPDIVTSAKALGNGMPIGACLANEKIATVLGPGTHGSTFGGNPLACRVALTVIDVIEKNNLLARTSAIGEQLLNGFKQALADNKNVKVIRGKGCMLGIELHKECNALTQQGIDKHILFLVTNNTTIRLLPPYICNDNDVDNIINTISDLIKQLD